MKKSKPKAEFISVSWGDEDKERAEHNRRMKSFLRERIALAKSQIAMDELHLEIIG